MKMKRIMKMLLTLAIIAVEMAAGSSVAMAQNYVKVDAANFPDKAIRNALDRFANEMLDYGEIEEDADYIEYDADNLGTFRRDSSGVIFVDIDSVEILRVEDVDGIVYNTDCLKLFSKLNSLYITKYGASSFTSGQKITNIILSGICVPTITVSAENAQSVSIDGTNNLKNVTMKAPKATEVWITGKKITKLSLGNMDKLETLYIRTGIKSLDVSKYIKVNDLTIVAPLTKLTGLNKLKKLQYVGIDKTKLKALDFTANRKLVWIYCDKNKQLTSIKIPISVNRLYVTDSNIKKLDLKKIKKLEDLYINGNTNLKSIDVSKNKNLERLNIGCTKISKLNLANNKKLTSLSCYQTKLNSLNLKKNTNLKYLSFYGSKIKKLNLSKQKDLRLSFETKKGKTISLKNYIGSGYKVVDQSDTLSYSKKTGKIKVKKKGYSTLTLKKGSRVFYVEIYAK